MSKAFFCFFSGPPTSSSSFQQVVFTVYCFQIIILGFRRSAYSMVEKYQLHKQYKIHYQRSLYVVGSEGEGNSMRARSVAHSWYIRDNFLQEVVTVSKLEWIEISKKIGEIIKYPICQRSTLKVHVVFSGRFK